MSISAGLPDFGAVRDFDATRRRAFTAARRHSRLVRLLRVLLPLAGALAVGGFVFAARLSFPGDVDLSAAKLSITRNAVIMDHPHLTGFEGDAREYSVSADRAIQPLATPGQVRVEAIEAKVTAEGRGTTAITAEAGDYDHEESALKLLGAIVVQSGDGYRLRMTGADVDFGAETMSSDNRVTIGYSESEISGDRMSVTDGGKHIVIEGNVRTVLMPPKRLSPAPSE